MLSNAKIHQIEQKINYSFNNKDLLITAFTHSSYSKNNNYEQLEFLGDSIINFLSSKWLFSNKQHFKVGKLSISRTQIINNLILSSALTELTINKYIVLGKNVKASKNITADVYEALIGAIYLDNNLEEAFNFFNYSILEKLYNFTKIIDYKGVILNNPTYNNLKISTDSFIYKNNNIFLTYIKSENLDCYGFGINKKESEQKSAKLFITLFE